MKWYAAILLTLPEVPALYTGEEDGGSYEPYRSAGPIFGVIPTAWNPAQLVALGHRGPALRANAI